MLRDIGMPNKVLREIAVRSLEVAEAIAGTHGEEEWVLHDQWQCAADHVWALTCYEPDRVGVAKNAANAARQLISNGSKHTNFYRACSLHYGAIADDLMEPEYYDDVTQAVNLLRDNGLSTPSSDHVEEMVRAIRSLFESDQYNSEDLKAAYDQILVHASDPNLSILSAEMCVNIDLHNQCLDSFAKTL